MKFFPIKNLATFFPKAGLTQIKGNRYLILLYVILQSITLFSNVVILPKASLTFALYKAVSIHFLGISLEAI